MKGRATVTERVRRICLSLPDTKETPTWGSPHFRVGEKIFAGLGEEDEGVPTVGLKLELAHARRRLRDPRFRKAPYVGHKGWVELELTRIDDWDEVRALILESYRLIAPKRSQAKLDAPGARPAARSAPARRKRPARKP